MVSVNVLMHVIFCTLARRLLCITSMLCQIKEPQYQQAGGVSDCKHECKNGAWQISGGVECELTQACNIMYFCKEAGVHHVDAVSDQRTTISASLGYVRLQTGS